MPSAEDFLKSYEPESDEDFLSAYEPSDSVDDFLKAYEPQAGSKSEVINFGNTYIPEVHKPQPAESIMEAPVALATGLAGMAVGGLEGIRTAAFTDEDPAKAISDVQSRVAYQPESESAKSVLETIALPFEWWRENVSEPLGEDVATPEVNFGNNYIPSIHKEQKGSPLAAAATYTAAEFLPFIFGGSALKGAAKGTYKGIAKASPKSAEYIDYVVNPIKNITEAVKESISPIATGTTESRLAAKKYANLNRSADAVRNEVIQQVGKRFKKEELEMMGRALIEEELAYKTGVATGKGISSLSPDMQQATKSLLDRHRVIAERAVEMGILKDSAEIYFPRKVIESLGDEAVQRIEKSAGVKLRTTTKHAKKRKYLTAEETAAAASERMGKQMKVVEDIRVLPLVTAELEKAIAGKQLVNEIKEMSRGLGVDAVKFSQDSNYFTINHPAMTEYKPRLEKVGGKYVHVKDEFGKPIFDKQPLFIHESLRGPLEAVLKNESGKIATAFMKLKAKSMSMIMFNPLMHGMVIWGKALPFQIGRTLTFRNYADGRRMMNGPEAEAIIREGTADNLAPIGNQGWMQRMNDVMSTPQLTPGRSTTANIAGAVGNLFGKGEAFKRAIDKAGEFWHDTLLWEPIRHAQYGMYKNLKDGFIDKGMTPDAAGKLAAHLANRFAGSIPMEDMGHGIRAATNFMLFSRTFNATNAGIYKDALKGLPTVIQEQILRSGKELDLKIANSALKKAARATLAKDILAMYVLNSMSQNVWEYMMTGDAGPIAKEYADNLEVYEEKVKENPLNFIFSIPELMAQSINEPGKENRVHMGPDPYGRGTYARVPIGKVGEDLEKLAVSPRAMLIDKFSPTAKFIGGVLMNDKSIDKGWGLKVFDPHGGLEKAPENLGNILKFFVESHTPSGFIESVVDAVSGEDPTGIQKYKAGAALLGFSLSKGAPGGPAMGQVYDTLEKHKYNISKHMPDVVKNFRLGKHEEAIRIMTNEGDFSKKDIEDAIRKINPILNENMIEKYMEIADKEEVKKINRMLQKFHKVSP